MYATLNADSDYLHCARIRDEPNLSRARELSFREKYYFCGLYILYASMRTFLSIALCGVLLFCSCAREPGMRPRVPRASDSLYTARAAMKVYGMEPERALTIIDSALIVGNVSPFQADFLRAKVYAYGSTRGAGIGGGWNTDGSSVTISGGWRGRWQRRLPDTWRSADGSARLRRRLVRSRCRRPASKHLPESYRRMDYGLQPS